MKSRLFAALASVILIVSCDPMDKPGGGSSDEVSVSLRSQSAGSNKGSVFVTVNCFYDWTLELDFGSDEQWASLSHKSGKGYKSNVLLNYDANETDESRTVRIILKSSLGEDMVAFTQAKKGSTGIQEGYGADKTSCCWLELPETNEDDGMEWFCHFFTYNGTQKRNYSFYYSYSDYVSLWVAYPLNSSLKGSGSRPKPEPWSYDPLIPADKQINIVDGGILSNVTNVRYDRGHQLPSADRYSGDSNLQTYYSTNITPQRSTFNHGIWVDLETKVRNWSISSSVDTMYVVTGCTIANSTTKARDRSGHSVTEPTAYWKACLRRTRSSGWDACGIWLDHYNAPGSLSSSLLMTIDELEEKIGIDLYVNLPAQVGGTRAAQIESTLNTSLWPM